MSDGDFEFPEAPLSPSLPTDFLEPPEVSSNGSAARSPGRSAETSPRKRAAVNSAGQGLRGSTVGHTSPSTGRTGPNAGLNTDRTGNTDPNTDAGHTDPNTDHAGHTDPNTDHAGHKDPSTDHAGHKDPSTDNTDSSADHADSNAGTSVSSAVDWRAGRTPSEKPSETSPSEKSKLSPEDARKSKELTNTMVKWVARARAKKHESDRASKERKHRLAAVLALDAVVCFMIGFDYEDRSEAVRAGTVPGASTGPVHPRSWATLVPYLAKLAAAAESVDADLAGVYYQVCAVVRLHVIYLNRRSVRPEESATGLYAALADFRRGLCLLPLHIIHNRYGLDAQHGWFEARLNPDRPDPVTGCAALPLHVNSSLGEAAAFALSVGRKWAQIEGIEYAWDAARTQ